MEKILKNKLIFSGHSDTRDDDDNLGAARVISSTLEARDCSYLKVAGMYKGVKERSFMLDNTFKNQALVHELSKEYRQDTYLEIDDNGMGFLVSLKENTGRLFIGFSNLGTREPKGDYSVIGNKYLSFYFQDTKKGA